jgi:hypothetical protein
MDDDEYFDEDKYERDQEEFSRLFPDIGFSICITLEQLDDILSTDDIIMQPMSLLRLRTNNGCRNNLYLY